jgi:protein involved in ribonucleotide reduction
MNINLQFKKIISQLSPFVTELEGKKGQIWNDLERNNQGQVSKPFFIIVYSISMGSTKKIPQQVIKLSVS